MRLIAQLIILVAKVSPIVPSSVTIDWTAVRPWDLRVAYWRVRYDPPIGRPPSGARLAPHWSSVQLNDTQPAREYKVSVSAVTDASRPAATPDAPSVERLAVTHSSATITLVPPKADQAVDTAFRVKYAPAGAKGPERFIESANHVITLSRLTPGTDYSARVSSIVHGLMSDDANFVTFTTHSAGPGDIVARSTTSGRINGDNSVTALIPWPGLGIDLAGSTSTVPPPKFHRTPLHVWTTSISPLPTTTTRTISWRTTPSYQTTQSAKLLNKWLPKESAKPFTPFWTVTDTRVLTSRKPTTTISTTARTTTTSPTTTTTTTTTTRITTTTSQGLSPDQIKRLRVSDARTDERAKSSVKLHFDWPKKFRSNEFDLVLTYASSQGRHVRALSGRGPVVIDGLYPATRYTFTVVNVTKTGMESVPATANIITPPAIESEVRAGRLGVNSATIVFTSTPQKHNFDTYFMLVSSIANKENITRVLPRDDTLDTNTVDLEGLQAGVRYTVALHTVYKKVRSEPVTATFTTYPMSTTHLLVIVRQREADLHWSSNHSEKPNIKYRLSYRGTDADETRTTYVSGRTVHRLRGLKPATWYTITLTTIMGDIESDAVSLTAVTNPTDVQQPQVSRYDEHELAVRYRADMFPYLNGRIANYSVIVASTRAMSDLVPHPPPTWQQVQARRYPWPAYLASRPGYNPFGGTQVASARAVATIFYVGTEYCLTADQTVYCNGPLKAEYEYAAKVRACSESGTVCMESDYVAPADGDQAHWLDEGRRKQNSRPKDKATTEAPTTKKPGKGLKNYFSNFWILRNAKYNAAASDRFRFCRFFAIMSLILSCIMGRIV